MKKLLTVLMIVSVMTLTGCANGPIRNFWRGAACYRCGVGQKPQASPCNSCCSPSSMAPSHTSFAPGYEMPMMPGAEPLPNPGGTGPAQ